MGAGGTSSTVAPSLRRRLIFSEDWSEGRMMCVRCESDREKVVRLRPVDPTVPS